MLPVFVTNRVATRDVDYIVPRGCTAFALRVCLVASKRDRNTNACVNVHNDRIEKISKDAQLIHRTKGDDITIL